MEFLSHKGGRKTEKRYQLGLAFRRRSITNPYFLTKGNQKLDLPNNVQEQIENQNRDTLYDITQIYDLL